MYLLLSKFVFHKSIAGNVFNLLNTVHLENKFISITCVDENFVRGGPTFMFLFLDWLGMMREEASKYHYQRAINSPPAKRHLNGLSQGQWWPNIECWIGSFVILRGSGPVLLRNHIFLSFSRGVLTPCHPLWIRTCSHINCIVARWPGKHCLSHYSFLFIRSTWHCTFCMTLNWHKNQGHNRHLKSKPTDKLIYRIPSFHI